MFAKIFRQIFDSSIAETPEVRFTFMDLLILADSDGVVDMTQEAIARVTNRPITVIKDTISALESEDPRSRTPHDSGKRIKRLDDHRDWGWVIVNFDRFRSICSENQKKEQDRERAKRYRDSIRASRRNRDESRTVTEASRSPSASVSASVPEGSTEGRQPITPRFSKPTIEELKLQFAKIGLPESEAQGFFDYYESNGWKVGRNPMRSWVHACGNWKRNWEQRQNKTRSFQPGSFNGHRSPNLNPSTRYGNL